MFVLVVRAPIAFLKLSVFRWSAAGRARAQCVLLCGTGNRKGPLPGANMHTSVTSMEVGVARFSLRCCLFAFEPGTARPPSFQQLKVS